ncbi:MAG: hypothetical protein ABIH41_00340 [Nanoarchaeota archaeon]
MEQKVDTSQALIAIGAIVGIVLIVAIVLGYQGGAFSAASDLTGNAVRYEVTSGMQEKVDSFELRCSIYEQRVAQYQARADMWCVRDKPQQCRYYTSRARVWTTFLDQCQERLVGLKS